MISQKPKLAGLLAVAALAAASTGASFNQTPNTQATSRRRQRLDNEMARQKSLLEQRMTAEQRAWNAAVEAKRATKK